MHKYTIYLNQNRGVYKLIFLLAFLFLFNKLGIKRVFHGCFNYFVTIEYPRSQSIQNLSWEDRTEQKRWKICKKSSVCSVLNVRKRWYVCSVFKRKRTSVYSVFKRKNLSVCLVLSVKNCRFFHRKIWVSVYNVVKSYDSVPFKWISNVLLREKFWKCAQNYWKLFYSSSQN